jgi:hypothetical protein
VLSAREIALWLRVLLERPVASFGSLPSPGKLLRMQQPSNRRTIALS